MMGISVTLHMGWSKERVLGYDVNKNGKRAWKQVRVWASHMRTSEHDMSAFMTGEHDFMRLLLGIASGMLPATLRGERDIIT